MNERQRVHLSKFLSLVLRHEPAKAGLSLDAAGWVAVDQLIEGCNRHGCPIALGDLREVVATSDKKRFEFSPNGAQIRASQGHSVPVDLGYEPAEPPEILFHGTADRNGPSIRRLGILKGDRHHVHLSPDEATATKVGERHGRPIILVIESRRMHQDRFVFFRSANGVWLTDHVPAAYIRFAETR